MRTEGYARGAAIWHNRLFNPALPEPMHVIAFKPDWTAAESGPDSAGVPSIARPCCAMCRCSYVPKDKVADGARRQRPPARAMGGDEGEDSYPDVISGYNRQHRDIYNALNERDAVAAQSLITEHLEKARDDLLRANSP